MKTTVILSFALSGLQLVAWPFCLVGISFLLTIPMNTIAREIEIWSLIVGIAIYPAVWGVSLAVAISALKQGRFRVIRIASSIPYYLVVYCALLGLLDSNHFMKK